MEIYILFKFLAEDYVNNLKDGTQFTSLLSRMKKTLWFKTVRTIHWIIRLNDEFRRQISVDGNLLPVQSGELITRENQKNFRGTVKNTKNSDPYIVARFIVKVIEEFSSIITLRVKMNLFKRFNLFLQRKRFLIL